MKKIIEEYMAGCIGGCSRKTLENTMDYQQALKCLRGFMEERGDKIIKGTPDPSYPNDPWVTVSSPGDGTAHLEATNGWYAETNKPEELYNALSSAFEKVFGSTRDLDAFISHLCPDSAFE